MTKEVTAIDVDDVVVKHVAGFIAWSNDTWGTHLTTADYTEAWHELWDIDVTESERRKSQFFTDEIIGGFDVVEGASEALMALAATKTLVAVTSRRESLRAATEQALELIAPGTIDTVLCATSFQNGEKITRSKSDICLEIGATDLVDDQLKHCILAARAGVRAVLFGDYDWQDTTLVPPEGVACAKDWNETLAYFGIRTALSGILQYKRY
jgi:hypothetical protein